MVYILTPVQVAQYVEGNWLASEVEETVLEDLDRLQIHEPVAVILGEGGPVAFYVTEKGVVV